MSKLSRERAGELAFLYCKASGLNTISKLVSDDMFTEVCGSYNCVVQETVLANNGFIAKTDSHSAYIIVFNDIYQAVNTARKIQLGLMAVDWPSKILTLEASLRVKSIKTGMLLFNGIRAMTAIHVSRDYSWTRVQNPIDGFEAVDMCGPAIEILMAFARKACSGEILLTDAAQRSIRSTFNGSVFLDQFEVVPVDDSLMDGLAAYSCAPKSVRERLDMLSIQERSRDPPVALRQKHRSVDGRSKSAISSSEKDMWWVDQSSSVTPLPVALQVSLGVARSSAQDDISAATSEAMDHIASRLKYEVASSVDLSTNCECFLNIAREVVSNLRLFFRNWGDKDERSISFKKTSLVEPFSTENCADEHMPLMQDGERSPRAHLRRFPRSVTLTNINTAWCEDKYKAVLNTIEETLKTTAKRNIRGGGGSTAAVPKVIKPATPSLERGVTRPKKRLPPIQ
ncbi:hypothetical protein TRVL_06758 [Trypanosoma vivax]|nr:hypothetical protein TRVL_06758 [Trypanosoma vivax]